MNEGVWMNKRTGALRTGCWSYYWPSDRFNIHIKGLAFHHSYEDLPEYGDWVYIGNL